MAWLTGWTYRRKIIVWSGGILGPITNFPVYISESGLDANFWSHLSFADGSDIRFTAADGSTVLNSEITAINTGSQTLEAHFNSSSLSASDDNVFYMYYGNSVATMPSSAGTYTAYRSLYHINEASGNLVDSAGGFTATITTGTGVPVYSEAGEVSTSINFRSATANSYGTTASQAMPTTAGSIMGWMKLTGTENWQSMTTHSGYRFRLVGSMGVRFYWDGSSNTNGFVSAGVVLTNGVWYHLAGVYDGTGRKVYVNGKLANSDSVDGVVINQPNAVMYIAAFSATFHKLYGNLDEVAVAHSALDASHINAAYVNQSAPTNFYGMDTEETETGNRTISHVAGTGLVFETGGKRVMVIA